MSKTLWGTMLERAMGTFTEVDWNDKEAVKSWYNKESWQRWYEHYLATAEIIYNEFVAEGLLDTAAQIRKNIEFTKKLSPKEEAPMSRRVEDWLIADGFPILLFVDPVTGERLTPEDNS